jgi:hypothetical protein
MCISWCFFKNRVKMHGDDNIKFTLYSHILSYHSILLFIHSAVCLTTGP